MIKILHIVPALDGGGVENLLLNYYLNMNRDKFKFDFIVYGEERGALESTFEELGSTIYHIPSRHEDLFKSLKQMKKIIYCNGYNIVHAHQNRTSFIPLFYAKRCGISTRIAHSHMAYEPENIIKKLQRKLFSLLIKYYANHWFACGIEAGKWLYGKKTVAKGKVNVMNNAIDLKNFIFNENIQKQKRKELGIEGKFVVGHVGRISYQKNHKFLIEIFNEIYKLNKDVVLLLAGRGELESEVKEQVENLGLTDVVKFLGVRNDVPELLQAMDVFLLPSRYEGLPVVLVEAQASGVICFASDTITKEIQVTNTLKYMSLTTDPSIWAKEILYSTQYKRENNFDIMQNSGYSIEKESKLLEVFYLNAINGGVM